MFVVVKVERREQLLIQERNEVQLVKRRLPLQVDPGLRLVEAKVLDRWAKLHLEVAEVIQGRLPQEVVEDNKNSF